MSPSWREALHRGEGLATYGIGREQGLQFAVNNGARLRINDGESQVHQSFNIQHSIFDVPISNLELPDSNDRP
jgi:hypothetical protein